MATLHELLPSDILSASMAIPEVGISHSWPATTVSTVVRALEEANVAILGGDVLMKLEGRWTHVMPNWLCDIRNGEPWAAFASRSRDYALEFLAKQYGGKDVRFVPVVASKPTAAQLAKSYAR